MMTRLRLKMLKLKKLDTTIAKKEKTCKRIIVATQKNVDFTYLRFKENVAALTKTDMSKRNVNKLIKKANPEFQICWQKFLVLAPEIKNKNGKNKRNKNTAREYTSLKVIEKMMAECYANFT